MRESPSTGGSHPTSPPSPTRPPRSAACSAWKPDAAILFWDTCYENLLPHLRSSGLDVYGYLARPPFAAGATFAAERLHGATRVLGQARMAGLERRHIGRMQDLKGARNICAIDTAWYDTHASPVHVSAEHVA